MSKGSIQGFDCDSWGQQKLLLAHFMKRVRIGLFASGILIGIAGCETEKPPFQDVTEPNVVKPSAQNFTKPSQPNLTKPSEPTLKKFSKLSLSKPSEPNA